MENEKLQNGINEIRQIKMTTEEKKRVFENILNTRTSQRPSPSPWFSYSFMAMIKKNHLAYYVILPLIIFTSGGVVFASGDSLPSGLLYPLKVEVVEPIRGALTFSPTKKAKYESGLATKRLVEAEVLVSKGKLNSKEEEKINGLIEKHTLSLNNTIQEIDRKDRNGNTDEIVVSFRAEMKAHARVLEMMQAEGSSSAKDNKISETARLNADKVKNDLEDENEIADKYNKKKDKIESIIDSEIDSEKKLTDFKKDPNQTSITATPIFIEEEDDKESSQKSDGAKYYLEKALEKEQMGDQSGAYSALLDYESSIQEEHIFSENQYKINQIDKKNKNKDKDKDRDHKYD